MSRIADEADARNRYAASAAASRKRAVQAMKRAGGRTKAPEKYSVFTKLIRVLFEALVHPRRRQQAGAAQVTGRPPKITREQYLLLRMRAASGVKHRILAREYGLTRQSVQRIAREGLKHYEAQP